MQPVAVVILNWNGLSFLQRFLPDVVRYSPPGSVYVADNASTDGSVAWARTHQPAVHVLENHANRGYSAGYNEALRRVEARYYVLLNSDVRVTPGWLDPLRALLDAHPNVAACQPKIKAYHQPERFEYAGAAGGFLDRWGYPFCRGRFFDYTEPDQGQYDDTIEVFWASGACLFIRADAYWQAGGLDEDYFAHMEEIELCWRLRNLGYRVATCGESTVYHVGGGTLSRSNPRKTYLNFLNNLSMLAQHLPARQLPGKILIRMVLDGVAALRFLAAGQQADFAAVARAHGTFYRRLPRLWRKRQRSAGRARTDHRGMWPGSIVWAYFVRGKRSFADLTIRTYALTTEPTVGTPV